ncbi:VOC family protein [Hoyosella altamirensis]|uniref:Putative glyoxalase superfamily protein PhnB n=1 Tax=Hoyosella altamirensis TaxID=616997 RepID=A0A839RH47_9ACTN|nr:VOC family protein [Hoyosella altamirensis]MBB3035740.1 putative glyoxalase superfamily protein PhnB [Hoyosella altamirensis]
MKPRLNVIALVVSDMSRSLAFYRQLGLDIPADADSQPHVEYELAGGVRLAWDDIATIRTFDPGWEPPGHGQVGLAFECASPSDVDSAYQDLVDAGYKSHMAPWDAFWGQRYAVINDPDGNSVDLYAPLPAISTET